jgi:hypothetical protein
MAIENTNIFHYNAPTIFHKSEFLVRKSGKPDLQRGKKIGVSFPIPSGRRFFLADRVNGLGDFSPIGRLLTLGSFLKFAEVSKPENWGTFSQKYISASLAKMFTT